MEGNKTPCEKICELFNVVADAAKQSAESDREKGKGITPGTATAIDKTIELFKVL